MRLLVAEDDPRLLKTLLHIFQSNNFSADGVSNGRDALLYARSTEYDGLVLDIMMPEMDGIQVLRELRRLGINTPALFLTARTEVAQRVEGLDAGADDYLPKPFATAELLARVRAMLRRKETYLPDRLACGPVVLNRSSFQLEYQGCTQPLSGREFQILEMLMQAPGSIVPTERLITHLWGWDATVDTSVVWVHISNLRKKISVLNAPLEIRFVRGAGYTLEVTA
ncbi:response regulator transcription factor [Gemmiger formicilis]|uniref:response regulator transcription factor n=1 Tax=Gemmiger formicilis TaxID=745368 RepID=UPI00195B2D05|nr:response regulator transcription factor [Gemmiger formicilis]MBM6915335.1 response regulator transcription factor [Gemmiger formicilis]